MARRSSCVVGQTPSFTIENGIIKGEKYPYEERNYVNFGEMILDKMKENPSFIGQINSATGNEDTFGNMVERSIRCALWIKSQDIKTGDVVAICTHNHENSIIPCLASLYTGMIFNPWWDFGLTKDVARHFIKLTNPKILFVNEECAKIAMEVVRDDNLNLEIVVFGSIPGLMSFKEIIEEPRADEVLNFQCTKLSSIEHPALILYTSGTTGLPKGALHSHRSMFGNIRMTGQFAIDNTIAIWYSAMCWVTGVLCSFACLANKSKRVIAKDFSGDEFCELVQNYKIKWSLMGTSLANRLLTSGALRKYNMSTMECIWISGAILKEESQKALKKFLPNTNILQAYGTTELGGVSVHQTNSNNLNSIGTIVRNFEMKIIDPDSSRIMGANEKGEACFKCRFMMTGYIHDLEKTREAIDSEGWFHTGDLSYYDEEGYIYIVDRMKELIKWRGQHISPAIIEQLIQTYPGVIEAAVVPVPHIEDIELPFAFVAKSPDTEISKEKIMKLVEDNLPEQMKLRGGVEFVEQIPHTASGKIKRSQLKKIAITIRQRDRRNC